MGYFIVGLDWTSAFWQKKIYKQEIKLNLRGKRSSLILWPNWPYAIIRLTTKSTKHSNRNWINGTTQDPGNWGSDLIPVSSSPRWRSFTFLWRLLDYLVSPVLRPPTSDDTRARGHRIIGSVRTDVGRLNRIIAFQRINKFLPFNEVEILGQLCPQ